MSPGRRPAVKPDVGDGVGTGVRVGLGHRVIERTAGGARGGHGLHDAVARHGLVVAEGRGIVCGLLRGTQIVLVGERQGLQVGQRGQRGCLGQAGMQARVQARGGADAGQRGGQLRRLPALDLEPGQGLEFFVPVGHGAGS